MRYALKLRLPTVELRTPSLSDAETLRALAIDTFCETFAYLYPAADLQQFLVSHYSLARIEQELAEKTSLHLIAWCDGEAVGFVRARDNTLPIASIRPAQMELQRLYVKKDWQGLGIGQVLMDAAIGSLHARGAQEICLGVWEENEKAQRFYAKYGFEPVGTYFFHVGSQKDREIIMRRVG